MRSLRKLISAPVNIEEIPALVQLWMWRMLVPLGAYRDVLKNFPFDGEAVISALGVNELFARFSDETEIKESAILRNELRDHYEQAEKRLGGARTTGALEVNIGRLAELVGLSPSERRVLEFAVLVNHEYILHEMVGLLGELSIRKTYAVLGKVLSMPDEVIRSALDPKGVLERSGLLICSRDNASTLGGRLKVLSEPFANALCLTEADPVNLLSDMVTQPPRSKLAWSDYAHVTSSLSVLRPYLRHAVETGRSGVNIFVYGPPGTGKSELARLVADDLECELFEVSSEDRDGDPINGSQRLAAYRAAQSFFSNRRALIVFDEMEDVFDDHEVTIGRKSTAQRRKAWLNRMLEGNRVPALWISNSRHGFDPAFIRRFDLVLELPIPPRRQRERILHAVCDGLLDARAVARVAEMEHLAPAVVARAASVVGCIRDELGVDQCGAAIEEMIGNTLEAQGKRRVPKDDPNRLPEVYDPAIINSDMDLIAMADGLAHARAGRICLYGPPGTGKTAYARWLAGRLDLPLHVKRASDLLSAWLGETEENIARAFRAAAQEGAVLLIDEVDGFLQDRRSARRGWEVSQVNEMLTQMESFPGIYLASTNLMDRLDQAALRRFDLKARFGYLTSTQSWELLCRHAPHLGLGDPDLALKTRLGRLDILTPGDFAAVARQHRFRPLASAADLIDLLEAECTLKGEARAPIGFC